MSWTNEIRVVIGLDFGTTYSGFSLHHIENDDVGNIQANSIWPGEQFKPKLPVDFKKAIVDYLREMGKCIKETIPQYWPGIDFMNDVLLVLTIPAEYSENDKAIMRECTFNAGLISDKNSERLQFTTEPEAAAIYCMNCLKEYKLTEPGTTFMVVDCGGGTVDLTTRKLLEENQLA
ncbi:unnamed protein product [Rhizophagus irregularis]|uniref:Actin-like ATPase domain-containing protein n=1 Tax=Rhizophagus irregularis TaxID=588596 RepID=A0A916EGR6_9GLOM|nr:unnamed protein product [Rhizophagus irregularis]CAB5381310.1 unnamed protein product [Rhizophagus irregularis]